MVLELNPMFTIIPMLIAAGFVVVFGIVLVSGVRGAAQWQANNEAPVQTGPATVVAKRSHVQGRHGHEHGGRITTIYYATFELANGERQELRLPSEQYSLLADDDQGSLTFQGTRFHTFTRA